VLNHAILAMSGISSKEWASQYFDLIVCELLRNTEMKMGEIATRVGFSSGNTLDTFFKRMHKGMTPYEYRHGRMRIVW
jgi:AraC-like DNA-binding protein